MNNTNVIFWFLPTADGESFPQLSNIKGDKKVEYYLDSLIVAAASTRRWNPSVTITLVSENFQYLLPFKKHQNYLLELGVEFKCVRRETFTPEGFYQNWQSQFYILDIMRSIEDEESNKLILDLDVIICGPLSEIETLESDSGGLIIPYSEHLKVNGLSRDDLTRINRALNPHYTGQTIPYCGGEVIFFRSKKTSNLLDEQFKKNLHLFENGELHANEEAHLLSLVAANQSWFDLGSILFVKRIWTQPWVYRNVSPNDRYVRIKHLPGEKKTSLRLLGRQILSQKAPWFWNYESNEWNSEINYLIGTPKYTFRKLILDFKVGYTHLPRSIMKRLRDSNTAITG